MIEEIFKELEAEVREAFRRYGISDDTRQTLVRSVSMRYAPGSRGSGSGRRIAGGAAGDAAPGGEFRRHIRAPLRTRNRLAKRRHRDHQLSSPAGSGVAQSRGGGRRPAGTARPFGPSPRLPEGLGRSAGLPVG
jgi:hypothetical protein